MAAIHQTFIRFWRILKLARNLELERSETIAEHRAASVYLTLTVKGQRRATGHVTLADGWMDGWMGG